MKNSLLLLLVLSSLWCKAQTDSLPYSRELDFKEGLYLTFSQFKQNRPIPLNRIVSDYPRNQLDFLNVVTEKKYVKFQDNAGTEQKVETASLWGYCRNHSICINFNHEFNKLNTVGVLCYFTSTVTCSTGMPDPMGMNSTYEELRQFVYDSRTNKVYDFNVKNMETLIHDDTEMYDKFMAMKKRDKPDVIFVLLRKYNEKHPLFVFR